MTAPSTEFAGTPNVEQYVLALDTLRRRQLQAALLHGGQRSWRRRPRLWPAVVVGVVLIALVIAGITVAGAFQRQREIDEQQQQRYAGSSAAVSTSAPARVDGASG